ncbi:uncharacterized protein J4E84_002753 [Alternaria hordeiaustralica]|uniref:uncharacterized protein n=1 Tax=Alternaria hordeiaustralica TaxID=1187925 RepID=UPI0020C21C5B|nr:uncharacterized protein J4E84_002753 [Alternaria hordeiaustralica]KAI4694171.1 hypothetical protein J4E84_002753 [Alternaria hordeiaustralica]
MKAFPMILFREFNGRDTSYRVAARRARNYWELIANVHNIFVKPWERYNAHIHFDGHACDDRISPSEWDAGGYFDPEFVVDGRLVLYVHFEQVEPPPESSMDAHNPFETEEEDKLWYRGTYGDQGLRTKALIENLVDTMQRKFAEYIENYLGESKKDSSKPSPKGLPHNPFITDPILESTYTLKSSLALPVAANEVVTVDDSSSSHHFDTGVVIGRALPQSCLDPNVRPVVRAVISKVGAVVAYIPAKYSKRSAIKGDIQIAMTHVEYTPELVKFTFGEERTRAIKAMIEERNAPHNTGTPLDPGLSTVSPSLPIVREATASEASFIIIDDTKHSGLRKEGVVIGHAKEHWCLTPHKRPAVRAMLNKKNNVIAYIPARHTGHTDRNGEIQIPLKDVNLSKSLVALPLWKLSDAIRAMIRAKRETSEKSAVHGSDAQEGGVMKRRRETKTKQAIGTAANDDETDSFSDSTDVTEGGAQH